MTCGVPHCGTHSGPRSVLKPHLTAVTLFRNALFIRAVHVPEHTTGDGRVGHVSRFCVSRVAAAGSSASRIGVTPPPPALHAPGKSDADARDGAGNPELDVRV